MSYKYKFILTADRPEIIKDENQGQELSEALFEFALHKLLNVFNFWEVKIKVKIEEISDAEIPSA